jgi:hypothetical protein
MARVARVVMCRLGIHHWPDTVGAGAQGAACQRCGKPRGTSSLNDRLRSFFPFT